MQKDIPFHVVGVSHHTASVEERERFALTPTDSAAVLSSLSQAGRAALILSTCNRFELYWAGPWDGRAWFRELASVRGGIPDQTLTSYDGRGAVRHLFSVAAGLDSQILGETEILGQVRRAYEAARSAGTTTREMDLIFSAALASGRRVRRETLLGRHPASVASAAVDLVVQERGPLSSRKVLVLGAGEAAEGVLRSLHERGATQVTLLSRHPERARALASAWGAEIGLWKELERRLESTDVLLVATSSSRPLVTAAQVSHAMLARDTRELMVLDLAVPRNVAPDAGRVAGIQLLDLDDLQRLCCPGAGAASESLAEAHQILEAELVRLERSLRQQIVAPQLAELHRLGNELAQQEVAWALDQLKSLSEPQREIVREMADRLVRRVLYPVSRNLREHARTRPLYPPD